MIKSFINTDTATTDAKIADQNNVGVDVEKHVRKKYIITQQEIQFHIRNADGTIRIINKPLITGEKDYGSLRKRRNSQPSLNSTKQDDDTTGGLGHIENVGNINQETESVLKHQNIENIQNQNKQWRSSGSIFDCEQKCFNDDNDTMVI